MSQYTSPDELEKHHVRDVYNEIAPHFVGSRHKAWPKVEEFLLSLPAGSLIADVGCGTGRYLDLVGDQSFTLGSDSCMKFSEIAAKRGHNVLTCDNQNLPLKDNRFDAVISIGVIHHFASAKRRMKALEELYRILKPGGKMLVYVWAFEQDERKFNGQDVLVPFTQYQRNTARRRKSTPLVSRIHPLMKVKDTSDKSASSWQSRQAFSLDEPKSERNRYSARLTMEEDLCKQDARSSKFSRLQHVRIGGKISTFDPALDPDCRNSSEVTPVAKLKKFLNDVLEKLFDDKASETTPNHPQEKADDNLVSMDTNLDLSAKLSALISNFSLKSRPRYLNGEFLSLLAKKLFPSKEELDVNGFDESSVASREAGEDISWSKKIDHSIAVSPSNDVIIGLGEKKTDGRLHEDGADDWHGVSLGVVVRLVETLASSSDAESDSSSSSDYVTSDSSAAEDCDRVRSRHVTRNNKVFHHTTVNCQDKPEKESANSITAPGDSLSSSSSSSLSASSSLSSSASPSPSPSTKPPKKVKSKLHQRYYHVFCAGELVKLVQEGIPSAVLLKEYHDHGNWAAVWEKESLEPKVDQSNLHVKN